MSRVTLPASLARFSASSMFIDVRMSVCSFMVAPRAHFRPCAGGIGPPWRPAPSTTGSVGDLHAQFGRQLRVPAARLPLVLLQVLLVPLAGVVAVGVGVAQRLGDDVPL